MTAFGFQASRTKGPASFPYPWLASVKLAVSWTFESRGGAFRHQMPPATMNPQGPWGVRCLELHLR